MANEGNNDEYEVWSLPKTKNVMKNHCSYHGEITGAEATDRLLSSKSENCYLTRYSKTKKSYMLTVRSLQIAQGSIAHFKLKIDNKKCIYEVESTKQKFSSVDELLTYYETNPLSEIIRRIGKPCLLPELQKKKEKEEEEAKEQLKRIQGEQTKQQEEQKKEAMKIQRQQQQFQQKNQQEIKQQQEMIITMMDQQKETQKKMDELQKYMEEEITEQKKQIAQQQEVIAQQQGEIKEQKTKLEQHQKKSSAQPPKSQPAESNCIVL